VFCFSSTSCFLCVAAFVFAFLCFNVPMLCYSYMFHMLHHSYVSMPCVPLLLFVPCSSLLLCFVIFMHHCSRAFHYSYVFWCNLMFFAPMFHCIPFFIWSQVLNTFWLLVVSSRPCASLFHCLN
jgi:hypothetical protein